MTRKKCAVSWEVDDTFTSHKLTIDDDDIRDCETPQQVLERVQELIDGEVANSIVGFAKNEEQILEFWRSLKEEK